MFQAVANYRVILYRDMEYNFTVCLVFADATTV